MWKWKIFIVNMCNQHPPLFSSFSGGRRSEILQQYFLLDKFLIRFSDWWMDFWRNPLCFKEMRVHLIVDKFILNKIKNGKFLCFIFRNIFNFDEHFFIDQHIDQAWILIINIFNMNFKKFKYSKIYIKN